MLMTLHLNCTNETAPKQYYWIIIVKARFIANVYGYCCLEVSKSQYYKLIALRSKDICACKPPYYSSMFIRVFKTSCLDLHVHINTQKYIHRLAHSNGRRLIGSTM